MQRTGLAIMMKKREIRKKLLLTKTRTARRSCSVKKGGKLMHGETKMWEKETNAWWENFITKEVPELEWKDNFRMSR